MNNSNINDNENNSEITPEVNETEAPSDSSESLNNNQEAPQLGNGYNPMASSNREAFTRGLNDNYADRIARNKANLAQARARSNETQKKGEDGKLEDKNSLDRAKDKANVLKNKTALMGSQIDNARSKAFQMMHPIEAQKIIAKKAIKKWLIGILLSSLPMLLSIFVVFIACFFVLGLFDGAGGSGGGTASSLPVVDDICESITVEGIGTMSVDDYVAGVVGGEVESFTGHPEIQKALSIAARTYGLAGATKDGNGNCTVPNGEDFQVYDENKVNDTIIEIVEQTSGMVLVNENNNIVSSQYDSILLVEAYDLSGDYVTLKQQNLEIPKEWLLEVKEPDISCPINAKKEDDVDLNRYRERYDGYGCGHGKGLSQWGGLYLEMEMGYDYIEILNFFYGENTDYNYSLASINEFISNSTSPNNGNFQPLSSYNLKHKGLTKLNRVLTESERASLNNFVNSEVDKAGYGTGEAVAAAGQALTYELERMGYFLGYYWGGDRTSMGIGKRWGSNAGIAYTKNHNPTGPEYGMDCSGFVSWAIRNACKPSYGSRRANFEDDGMDHGDHISIEEAKPGDLMLTSGHVRLVLKNNGDGTIIVAEESYGYDGLVFTKRSFDSEYKIIDMSEWYSANCGDSR